MEKAKYIYISSSIKYKQSVYLEKNKMMYLEHFFSYNV